MNDNKHIDRETAIAFAGVWHKWAVKNFNIDQKLAVNCIDKAAVAAGRCTVDKHLVHHFA